MFFFGKIILRNALILQIILIGFSGSHRDNKSESGKQVTNADKNDEIKIPNLFPNGSINMCDGEKIPGFPFNNYKFCWANIYKTFWNSVVENNRDKIETSKMSSILRRRYEDFAQNITDNVVQIMHYVSEINNLLDYDNAKSEDTWQNHREVVKEDSFTKSVIVPVLLIVILLLLAYVGLLYRKLQTAHFRDGQILIEDELIDP